MKLDFLGTSHGVNEPDRYCTSTLVNVNGKNFIIDAGAPLADLLIRRRIPLETVKAIFITHMHSDHIGGLPQFAALISWYYKKSDPAIFFPKEGGIDALNHWLAYCYDGGAAPGLARELDLRLTSPGVTYDDGEVRVRAIPTGHGSGGCAYIIECEGKRVGFSGDLCSDFSDMPQTFYTEHFDAIVFECAHIKPAVSCMALEACDVDRVIFNHINPGIRGFRDVLLQSHKFKLQAAFDGLVLEI